MLNEIKEFILNLFLNPVFSALSAVIVTQIIGMARDRHNRKHSAKLFAMSEISDFIFKAYADTVEALFKFRNTFIDLTRLDISDRAIVFKENLFDIMLTTSKTSIFTDEHINIEIEKITSALSSFASNGLFSNEDIDGISKTYHKMLHNVLEEIKIYNGAKAAHSFFRKKLSIKK